MVSNRFDNTTQGQLALNKAYVMNHEKQLPVKQKCKHNLGGGGF
jgi:hypothetical protein